MPISAGLRLPELDLRDVISRSANLSDANLPYAKLSGVDLSSANLEGIDLDKADLSNAILKDVNLEDVLTMEKTDLRGVKGLTRKQLRDCKAKGAIIDEDSLQSVVHHSHLLHLLHNLSNSIDFPLPLGTAPHDGG